MMSKTFSTREKILLMILIVLLIIALYFLAVFLPTSNIMLAAENEIAEIADFMNVELAKADQITKMQEALDDLAVSSEPTAITPLFDNFQNLLEELNIALSSAEAYKLNFLEPKMNEGVAKRELQLIFFANNYNHARDIINTLYSGPYRCDIVSFKLEPTEKESSDMTRAAVTAALSIFYYEINKETAPASTTN